MTYPGRVKYSTHEQFDIILELLDIITLHLQSIHEQLDIITHNSISLHIRQVPISSTLEQLDIITYS